MCRGIEGKGMKCSLLGALVGAMMGNGPQGLGHELYLGGDAQSVEVRKESSAIHKDICAFLAN